MVIFSASRHHAPERTEPPVRAGATLPAPVGGEAAMGPSLIPQEHGGALLSGGKPGNPGHNQHTGTYGGIDRTAVSTGVGARAGPDDRHEINPRDARFAQRAISNSQSVNSMSPRRSGFSHSRSYATLAPSFNSSGLNGMP